MKDRESCFLGMGDTNEEGEIKEYLVELNTKTLELKRSLLTKYCVC